METADTRVIDDILDSGYMKKDEFGVVVMHWLEGVKKFFEDQEIPISDDLRLARKYENGYVRTVRGRDIMRIGIDEIKYSAEFMKMGYFDILKNTKYIGGGDPGMNEAYGIVHSFESDGLYIKTNYVDNYGRKRSTTAAIFPSTLEGRDFAIAFQGNKEKVAMKKVIGTLSRQIKDGPDIDWETKVADIVENEMYVSHRIQKVSSQDRLYVKIKKVKMDVFFMYPDRDGTNVPPEPFWLPEYEIMFYVQQGRLQIHVKSTEYNNNYCHPHIGSGMCKGSFAGTIGELLESFDIGTLLSLMEDFLRAYNGRSPFVPIFDFIEHLKSQGIYKKA